MCSSFIREMNVKSTVRCLYTPIITAETGVLAGRWATGTLLCWWWGVLHSVIMLENFWQLRIKSNIRLLYDSAIPLLPEKNECISRRGIYPREDHLHGRSLVYKWSERLYSHRLQTRTDSNLPLTTGELTNTLPRTYTETWTSDTVAIWMSLTNILGCRG